MRPIRPEMRLSLLDPIPAAGGGGWDSHQIHHPIDAVIDNLGNRQDPLRKFIPNLHQTRYNRRERNSSVRLLWMLWLSLELRLISPKLLGLTRPTYGFSTEFIERQIMSDPAVQSAVKSGQAA